MSEKRELLLARFYIPKN